MREITARALAGAVGGILVHEGDAPSVEHISLDSRKMTGNDLFVPIIGERADGHDYICMALPFVRICFTLIAEMFNCFR